MSKPREFFLLWTPVEYMPNFGVWDVKLDDFPVHAVNQEKIHVIEYSAYEQLKQKHAELLSYMPKVPTQPYEKQLAVELEAERARSQKLLEALDYSFRMGALNHQLSEAQCRVNLFKISENSREAIAAYKAESAEPQEPKE